MTDNGNNRDQEKDAKEAGQQCQQIKHWQKKLQQCFEGKKKDKDPEEIPVLKYGPSNNFFKSKEALLKTALWDFGHLGKLIKTGEYYKPPEPDIAHYDMVNDIYGLNRATCMDDLKEGRKEALKLHADCPKLYVMILQYLSEESADEIKRSGKWEEMEKKVVEETHKVTSISNVEVITKLAARNTYNMICQGPYESIIAYKERFNSALTAYESQDNLKLDEKDVAMDFFRSLDNAYKAISYRVCFDLRNHTRYGGETVEIWETW